MSTRLVPVAGAVLGLLLALLVVLGVALDTPLLTAVAAAALGAAVLTLQADTWRRIRSQRNFLRDEIRNAGSRPVAGAPQSLETTALPVANQEDVLGAVRLLQAQYTARLDRMQRTVEGALEQLPARRVDGNHDEGSAR